MMKIEILQLKCARCTHQWFPRKPEVLVCPRCHSPYWHRKKSSSEQAPPFKATLEEIVRRIVEVADPQKIILFGSHATGHAGPLSDVDLMVVTDKGESKRQMAVALYEALGDVGVAKDIVVVRPDEFEQFDDVPGSVIYPAAQEGRVIYERAA